MTAFILKLVGMIILGVLSAALSYYNRNYFVRVFDDILGREEEENTETKLGRGFIYGFLFPVYFVLLLAGLIALLTFLVAAGILAGIAFVLIWVTEKILPKDAVGALVKSVFDKIGLKGPKQPFAEASAPAATPGTGTGAPTPASPVVQVQSPASGGTGSALTAVPVAAPSAEPETKPAAGDAPDSGEKKDKPEEPKP